MIYLDHAAATPVNKKALQSMLPFFAENFYNPSAPYLPAKRVREQYETAKDQIAHGIGAKGADLVITAGATEAINLAFTVLGKYPSAKVLTLPIEHSAVLEVVKQHNCELVQVDKHGVIDLADLRGKISDDVVLVSVSLANNELGTIQPLAEVAEIMRAVRQDRYKRGVKTPIFLHSDASQALNLLDINVARLGVDLLAVNAAKCGGPKGVGALYVAHGVELTPVAYGGGQERGLRSGTENVAGVVGFATALNEAKEHLSGNRKKYAEMIKTLKAELAKSPIEPVFLGNPKHQLANFLSVSFPGIDAERIIYKLEEQEIFLATGAACAANKGTKSHVLTAIGLNDSEIAGSLRISLGSTNTPEQMPVVGQAICEAIKAELVRMEKNHG